MDNFILNWQRGTSIGCSNKDEGTIIVNGAPGSYEVEGLEEGNMYTVTVLKAVNVAGISGPSNSLTAITKESGESVSLPT